MKNKIVELIAKKPKHFGKIVKNNQELWTWVQKNTLYASDNLSETIYNAIHTESLQCTHGNNKKFKSITQGYGFCGRAATCACANAAISAKVTETKSQLTAEQQLAINHKRAATNLQTYGVTNAGQTAHALAQHATYYSSKIKTVKLPAQTPYQRLNQKFKQVANIEFATSEQEYTGVSNQTYYKFNCNSCNNVFSDYIDNGHVPKCKICNPYIPVYTSAQEQEVYDFVCSTVDCTVIQSDRTTINPYEIDILIPSLKIAIEYCGLYWHSEMHKIEPAYHLNKLKLCQAQGYRLVTIFEDEWLTKRSIVISRLKSILGESDRYQARKCKVEKVSHSLAKEFVEKHHIQGHAVFKVAFYQGKLLAVMTFGKPRYDRTADYELIRYCSTGNVIGGASKLLSAFVKEHNPASIVSYCDLRWGTGQVYNKLGFLATAQAIKPSYSYTDFTQRFHRSKFTKKSLITNQLDLLKTERQLMIDKKLYRIWDCGHAKWIWTAADVG
jgi:hypothetical protein